MQSAALDQYDETRRGARSEPDRPDAGRAAGSRRPVRPTMPGPSSQTVDHARSARRSSGRVRPSSPARRRSTRPAFPPPMTAAERHRLVLDGSTSARPAKSGVHRRGARHRDPVQPALGHARTAGHGERRPDAPGTARRPGKPRPGGPRPRRSRRATSRPKDHAARRSHGGWIIQIGATDAADKATDLLNQAKSQGRSALASAQALHRKSPQGRCHALSGPLRGPRHRRRPSRPARPSSVQALPVSRPRTDARCRRRPLRLERPTRRHSVRRSSFQSTSSVASFQGCRRIRTSLASFTRAARSVEPP